MVDAVVTAVGGSRKRRVENASVAFKNTVMCRNNVRFFKNEGGGEIYRDRPGQFGIRGFFKG